MKHELKRKPDVQKTTMFAIVVNAVQIGVLLAFVLYVLTAGPEARNSWSLQFMVIAGALMAAWGAGVDIQDALRTRRLERTIGELQTTNEQMDALNLKLRAQRHDFLNHLQVVYSLLEMQEYGEATAYLERVYDEHRSVSSVLRTKMTAFNALLQVKSAACEERGIALEMDIRSTLEGLPVPPWELCCIIGNLMDNAMDAVEDVPGGRIRLAVSEDLRGFAFVISNNGAPIPEELLRPAVRAGRVHQGRGPWAGAEHRAQHAGRIWRHHFSGNRPRDRLYRHRAPRKRGRVKACARGALTHEGSAGIVPQAHGTQQAAVFEKHGGIFHGHMDFLCAGLYRHAHLHAALRARGAGAGEHVRHLYVPVLLGVLSGAGSGIRPLLPRNPRPHDPPRAFDLLPVGGAGLRGGVLGGAAGLLALFERGNRGAAGFFHLPVPVPLQLLAGCFPLPVAVLPDGAERAALHHPGRGARAADQDCLPGGGLQPAPRAATPLWP